MTDFKIASAYVTADLRDNTDGDYQKLKKKLESQKPIDLETALQAPKNTAQIRERAKRGAPIELPTTAGNPIDAAWRRNLEASLKATATRSLQIPVTPENEGFRRELSRLLEQTTRSARASIPMELEDAAKFRREVETMARVLSEEVEVRVPVEVDKSSLAKASGQVDNAMSSVAKRANAKFSALVFAGMFAGMPIAAAAAAAATSVALGGVALGIAGLAAVALKDNERVSQSFTDLGRHVKASATEMAQPLEGTLVTAADKLGASFDRLQPQIATAMLESRGAVDDLTDGVTQLAENAMPGLVTAIRASDGPMKGWKSLFSQSGTGVAEFFTNLSTGAEGSGKILATTGGVVRDFLGFAGQLFSNLASNGNPALTSFQGLLSQVYATILNVTSAGSPLYSFVQGFSNSLSGALAVVQGFTSVLGMLPGDLVAAAGGFLALQKITGAFGMNLAGALPIISSFQRATNEAGQKGLSPFKQAMQDADKNGTSKFSAGLGALAGGFTPLSAALVLGGVALYEIGRRQQEAAAKSAEHKQRVDELTSAYRQSKGAMDDNIAQINQKAITDRNAEKNLSTFNQSLTNATLAIEGSKPAYDKLLASGNSVVDMYQKQGKLSAEEAEQFRTYNTLALEKGRVASDNINTWGKLTDAEKDHLRAVQNGLGTIGQQIDANEQARQAFIAQEAALANTTEGTIELMMAQQRQQAAAEGALNAALGLSGALDTLEDANKAVADAEKKHGKSSEEYTDAQRERAGVLLQVADAARTKAEADYAGSSETERANQGTLAYNRSLAEQVKLLGTAVGPEVMDYVSKMDAATAAASGFEIGVNAANEAVVRLPDGKEIKISGDATAAQKVISELEATNITNQLFTDTGPATGKVKDWQNMTSTISGETTTYTNTNPATGQVTSWKVITDATGAKTTVMTNTNPATGAVQVWKQNTDGTWAQVNVGANTASANEAINFAARDRHGNIYMKYIAVGGKSGNGLAGGLKDGGYVGDLVPRFADGGQIQRFPTGGMVQGPGGPRDDKVHIAASPREFLVNAEDTDKNLPVLQAINSGMSAIEAVGALARPSVTNNWNITAAPGMDERKLAALVQAEVTWQMNKRKVG